MRRLVLLTTLTAAVVAIGLLAGACDDDSSSGSDTDVIAAINILDKAGLHDIDTSIGTNSKVPANASTVGTQLQTTVLLTQWPNSDLKDRAKKLAGIFGELAAATAAGDKADMKRATTAAHNAHEGAHDFSHEVWAYLQKKAGIATSTGGSGE